MLQNDKLYQRLQQMRPRVGMYLSEMTLKHLRTFITGYSMALHDFSLKEAEWWHDFQNFAAEKLGYKNSTAGVANICLAQILGFTADDIDWEKILNHCFSKEQHHQAIDLFYTLLDEFSSQKEE